MQGESRRGRVRGRVLVIDDHLSTLNLIGEFLEEAGYEVELAPGGNEGIRRLRETRADLILLDLVLEDMDGWTVLKTIKTDDALQQVPVIIVTARQPYLEARRIEMHEGLFESYVRKPFLVDELLAEIGKVLP